jgi:ABC-type phosphate/phosphonate transport system permease subunit
MIAREIEVRRLRHNRLRDRFVRGSVIAQGLIAAYCWAAGDFWLDLFAERRVENLYRFLGELRPFPLQGQPFDWSVAANWASDLWRDRGFDAASATLGIAVAAIVLAGSSAILLALPAARNFASPEPFLHEGLPPARWRRIGWNATLHVTRFVHPQIAKKRDHVTR